MHVCSWCGRKLGIRPGSVRGVPATNYGMCPDCLAKRLAALGAAPPQTPHKPLHPLDLHLTRLKTARRLDEAV